MPSFGKNENVMIDQAVPRTALMICPAFSWALSIIFSSIPTVAATSAQAAICGRRENAVRKPSPSRGSSPLSRIRAQRRALAGFCGISSQ